MTVERLNPDGVAPPVGAYSHLAVVPAGMRLLVMSGQVGVRPDGSVAETLEAQLEQALANIGVILASQGASFADVVKLTYFFVERPADRGPIRKILAAAFPNPPASTLLYISGLASPDLKVEIEVMAAVPAQP
ncbi:MAG TPA: Rid family hydrolase [Caulobacteraceae bacterium]|jgi:enamine deaminase RidA (YjgF/YER057c/UK114 family)|nr:Rid family hydrolase [Caulobacteraceae bacterium]